MQPPLAAIFFMTYFHRSGGHGPLGPPGSANVRAVKMAQVLPRGPTPNSWIHHCQKLLRLHQIPTSLTNKQECIPVGCVPFAAVAVGGGGGCLPRGVSGLVHAGIHPRPGQNSRHTLVKTLPSLNYVPDGKNLTKFDKSFTMAALPVRALGHMTWT